MGKKSTYIFVVCGADAHIETLNFSLRYLKHFSDHPIWVVTDVRRNNLDIEHEDIIDEKTPDHFTHHQASIYLKTRLHKILPPGRRYCYLDTDVIAVDETADQVFEEYVPPVTFCADSVTLSRFSPYAIRCNCRQEKKENIELLDRLIREIQVIQDLTPEQEKQIEQKAAEVTSLLQEWESLEAHRYRPETIEKRERLQALFRKARKWPFLLPYYLLFRIFPDFKKNWETGSWEDRHGNVVLDKYIGRFSDFMRDHGYYYDPEKDIWYDLDDQKVIWSRGKEFVEYIEDRSHFKWIEAKEVWVEDKGRPVYDLPFCEHLRENLSRKFGVEIPDPDWQHWNGGVFLFDEQSHEFLDTWHKLTMEVFNDPKWHTRDQGTLIAAIWKKDLQNHKTLPSVFNLMVDYHMENYRFDPGKGFAPAGTGDFFWPSLVHIYHHFGDRSWPVWQWVESRLD